MKNVKLKNLKGFTLIEMLLVMVIISIVLVMGVNYLQQRALNMRIDKTTTQMQQILNASLAYYIANGRWPQNMSELYGFYIPGPITSPWGSDYTLVAYAPPNPNPPPATLALPLMYVYTPVTAGASTPSVANIIAGSLPLAYATAASGSSSAPPASGTACSGSAACNVVAAVNIPGQNLNNASAVNFAGVYHNGACVPAPQCPVDPNSGITMLPSIMVAPVSVSGVNDDPGAGPVNVYPISSFTAYAVSDGTSSPTANDPRDCYPVGTTNTTACQNLQNVPPTGTPTYWRVCLNLTTERGQVDPQNAPWGIDTGTVMAFTRCVINNEPAGSDFTVWSR